MTQLLEKAIHIISGMKEKEQDYIASLILDEYLRDQKWEKSFLDSEVALDKLSQEANDEFQSGKTELLSF